MCCRSGDRCLERTADGCEYVRSCASVADGPCAGHGGPAVLICGALFTTGYEMKWVSSPPEPGWTCPVEGARCPAADPTAACRAGKWVKLP
jgi:hypothetical protein